MPYRHPSNTQHPGGARTRKAPLALTVSVAATLAAVLAACGPGGGDPATGAGASRTAGRLGTVEAVLTPVAASTSGTERNDLGAANAIDHDDNTRWASAFNDDQYLTLDFGDVKPIDRVRISWENAHASDYLLQVSDDNVHWTTIKTVSNSAGGVEDFSNLGGKGRYLRMQGVKRSSPYGYSIFEIQAFSGSAAEEPPTDPTPPPDVDLSKPGVTIKPVNAISSATEGGLVAANAIDGKANTRWGSSAEDGAWITFDFGAKVPVGYMKLTWENAYGKEYALRTSEDGKTWTQLRYVNNGKGGTEEFFNLNVGARYIQLQGVARATQYGYSLFEVEFKTPGSDNTIAANDTTPLKYPVSGAGFTPLPTVISPIETIQFTLPDGRLVTRFGARSMARHGRERGEEWVETGYGLNETVDPITGLPQDKGPGAYLNFVPNYFQNRTWGIEIIDDSRVPGVVKPTLVYNQYTQIDFEHGQVAFFRAFDRPGVTGYGWMNPGEQVNDAKFTCEPVAMPAPGKLLVDSGINNDCTRRIKEYPGHAALGADGFPNGGDIKARPLVVGDVIEVAPSMKVTAEAMATKNDFGGTRYYGPEYVYVVGTGLRPWYGVQPRLNSVPLPDETLQGGVGSVSYNYSDEGKYIFQQPQNNTGMSNIQRFVEGRRLVHTNFTTGNHNEPGNDTYQAGIGLQGGRFNQSACIGCHVNNGRSPAPAANNRLDSMSIRVASVNADGVQVPHPQYGTAVQMNAAGKGSGLQNWGNDVRVAKFETSTAKLADGTTVELRKPVLAFEGATPTVYSLRSAQPMIGTGLLEAIPEADILARVRTTPDADGVKGTAQYVFDPETGAVRLGRFGWKAGKSTLRHQAAEALLLDMGVTSSIYKNRNCVNGPAACAAGGAQAGIKESDLQSISNYLALLAVPAQRSLASGFPKGVAPIEEMDVNPALVSAGAKLFQGMRCTACHTAEMKTGNGHLFAELRNQTIRPYSDLLLHDMGPGLADKFAEGQAKGYMWRTSPLWGIGYSDKVMEGANRVGYLHDGRARNLTEAIMWHGGEANTSRQRFEALSKADRDSLLSFLRSL